MRRYNNQDKWRKRAVILWRLKGSFMPIPFANGILTNEEKTIIRKMNALRADFLNNSVISSRELGFNAHYRCSMCGKPISDETYRNPEESDLCIKCKEEYE